MKVHVIFLPFFLWLLQYFYLAATKVIIQKSRRETISWNRNVIWDGFVLIGKTEKKLGGPIMSNFWGRFFHVLGDIFLKYYSVRTEKLHNMSFLRKNKTCKKAFNPRSKHLVQDRSKGYLSDNLRCFKDSK